MAGKLLILAVILGIGLVQCQPDLKNSYTLDKVPLEDRALFLADYLINNAALFRRLIRIYESSSDLREQGSGGPKSRLFYNYILDVLPYGLSSSETKDIAAIFSNELGMVNTTAAENEIESKHLLANSTEAKNIMFGAISKGFNKVRTLQRILTRHSAREFLPLTENNTISDICYNDMMNFIDAIPGIQIPPRGDLNYTFVPWALSMVDAYGKPRGGLSKGSLYWIGSYDLCRDIHAKLPPGLIVGNRTLTAPINFNGKFCRAQFTLPKAFVQSFGVDTRGVSLSLSWGMCVPHTCHSNDIAEIFDLGVLKGKGLQVHRITCFEDNDITEDTSGIVAAVLLTIFVVIALFATLVDGLGDWWKDNMKKTTSMAEYDFGMSKPNHHINEAYVPDSEITNGDATIVVDPPVLTETKFDNLPVGYVPHKNDRGDLGKEYYESSIKVPQTNGITAMETKPKSTTVKKPRDSIGKRLLMAFSIYTNLPKIMSAKKNPSAIHSLHGIRMFSMLWIVLAHTYNYGIFSEDDNTTTENVIDVDELSHRITFNGVMAAHLAVDTFFLISGFLVCYLTLKDLQKRTKRVNAGYFGMFYFHRFWRLTPVYMMIMMAYSCLYKYVGKGPLWPARIGAAEDCKANWWTNLLYVNNVVHTDERCMGWTWYLANDMQFYLISPLFILFMHYLPAVGVLLTICLMFAGISSSFALEYQYGGDMFSLRENPHYWPDVYIVPWTRVGSYCVGLLLGFLILKFKKGSLKNAPALIGWILTFAVGLTLVYLPADYRAEGKDKWPMWGQALYESFSRPLWALCVGWIVFACHNGKGGIIDKILSFSGFIPLSRLTYTCYLLHPTLQQIYVFSRRTLLYVNDYDISYLYMGHVVVSYGIALGFSLIFEAPFLTLEKILFGR